MMNLAVTKGSMTTTDDEESNSPMSQFDYMPFIWGILGLLVVLLGLFAWKRSHKDLLPENIHEAPAKEQPSYEEEHPQPVVEQQPTQPKNVEKSAPFTIPASAKGKQYLQEVLNATEHFFEEKLHIPHAHFQKETVFDSLQEKGNSSQDIHELKNWWLMLEAALYANMPLPEGKSKVLEEIKRITDKLTY